MNLTGGYRGAKQALNRFWQNQSKDQKRGLLFLSALLAFIAAIFVVMFVAVAIGNARFNSLSAKQHIDAALDACAWTRTSQSGGCKDEELAGSHLAAIPISSAEQEAAHDLKDRFTTEKVNVTHDAYERRVQNLAGKRHDAHRCARNKSADGIVTFDGGSTWWLDEGFCSDELANEAQRAQSKRDAEEQWKSYIPSTIRVDTDMNSSWLPDEQRTCISNPRDNMVIATVTCDADAKAVHNIPVKFWGSTSRGIVSSWRCIREESLLDKYFMCKAID